MVDTPAPKPDGPELKTAPVKTSPANSFTLLTGILLVAFSTRIREGISNLDTLAYILVKVVAYGLFLSILAAALAFVANRRWWFFPILAWLYLYAGIADLAAVTLRQSLIIELLSDPKTADAIRNRVGP